MYCASERIGNGPEKCVGKDCTLGRRFVMCPSAESSIELRWKNTRFFLSRNDELFVTQLFLFLKCFSPVAFSSPSSRPQQQEGTMD